VPAGDLGVSLEARLRVMRLKPVAVNRQCVRLADAAELVRRLRYEAKVI
jgi:hypothetical protein